jgi:hypothetical protein
VPFVTVLVVTDATPRAGIFATIRGLTAAQASTVGGLGRPTITGHIRGRTV